jgi:hypothetical protein
MMMASQSRSKPSTRVLHLLVALDLLAALDPLPAQEPLPALKPLPGALHLL